MRLIVGIGHIFNELREVDPPTMEEIKMPELIGIPVVYCRSGPGAKIRIWPNPSPGCQLFELREINL